MNLGDEDEKNYTSINIFFNVRKIGADMTNALLWAAFAIISLISILGMYQVTSANNNRTTSLNTINSIVAEARFLARNERNFQGITSQRVIESGALPTTSHDGASVIKIPYGGTINVYATPTNTGENLGLRISFPSGSMSARRLCNFIADGERIASLNGCNRATPYITKIYMQGDM